MDWKRFGFIALIIATLFTIVVMVGAQKQPAILIISSMIGTTIAVATPLTLGALSGTFCERSGVVNIGIEGMMLVGAFFGWLAAIYMNSIFGFEAMPSLLMGVLFAMLSAMAFAALHALLSITFKVDQVIGGTVINILAIGVTGFLNRQLFFEKGSVFGGQVPHSPGTLPVIHIPVDSAIQGLCGLFGGGETCSMYATAIGDVFNQKPIAITAILLVILSHHVLFNTRWGLRTRAVGEHPKAADTVGINVIFTRYVNVLIGGMLAGLAGAYLTIESIASFEPLMTNGRGFIALAAMIFGNWTPFGAWAAALVFGASQAFQIKLQLFRDVIPAQWSFLQNAYVVGLVPYILTMLILTGVIGKTTAPAADGQPYEK
jgi:simple sugar transport system permease protein